MRTRTANVVREFASFQYVIRSTSEEHINVFPVLKDGDFSSERLTFQPDAQNV